MSERIVVQLPLPMDLAAELLAAMGAQWPDACLVTDHDYGEGVMVVEVSQQPRNEE